MVLQMGMGKALLTSSRATRKLTRRGARLQENFQNIATDESLRPANSLGPTAVQDGRVLFSVAEERLGRNRLAFEIRGNQNKTRNEIAASAFHL